MVKALSMLGVAFLCLGATHTNWIAWDASPSSNIAGYKLLTGLHSGDYGMVKDVGLVRTQKVVWTIGTTSFYNVIAYNTAGWESFTNGELRLPRLPLNQTNYQRLFVQAGPSIAGPWTNYYSGPEQRVAPGAIFLRAVLSNYWR